MTESDTDSATNSAAHGAGGPVARNLRRWRMTREMTLAALAERAGVAKSTVSLIERGHGNPSVETISALAAALRVPFASIFHEEPPADEMTLIREHDSPVIAVEQVGLQGDRLTIRHLLTRTGGALIEIYTLVLQRGAVRYADAHVTGLFEHATVCTGSVEISTDSFSEVLNTGDLLSFRADRPHSYRVIDGPVRLVCIHEYPRRAPLD
jgi:XRE family transcriptional regulator, regulator of sulfur utilization